LYDVFPATAYIILESEGAQASSTLLIVPAPEGRIEVQDVPLLVDFIISPAENTFPLEAYKSPFSATSISANTPEAAEVHEVPPLSENLMLERVATTTLPVGVTTSF
jgi:hypothetical protein